MNSEANDAKHVTIKAFVDLLSENKRKRRELSAVFNDQDNEFHKSKLTNSESVTANRNPFSDNELSNSKICRSFNWRR